MYQMGRRPENLRVILVPSEDFVTELDLIDPGATFGGAPPALVFSDGSVFESSLAPDGAVAAFTITVSDMEPLVLLEDRTVSLVHQGVVLAKGQFEVA